MYFLIHQKGIFKYYNSITISNIKPLTLRFKLDHGNSPTRLLINDLNGKISITGLRKNQWHIYQKNIQKRNNVI